jgi:hypothetical protein
MKRGVEKINRKEFLQICQWVSALPETTMHIKTSIPPELTVLYDGIQFYPIGYEMTFKQGISQHTAILHDMKAHSVIYADLEKVEKYKE